jgi:hypothetical protein
MSQLKYQDSAAGGLFEDLAPIDEGEDGSTGNSCAHFASGSSCIDATKSMPALFATMATPSGQFPASSTMASICSGRAMSAPECRDCTPCRRAGSARKDSTCAYSPKPLMLLAGTGSPQGLPTLTPVGCVIGPEVGFLAPPCPIWARSDPWLAMARRRSERCFATTPACAPRRWCRRLSRATTVKASSSAVVTSSAIRCEGASKRAGTRHGHCWQGFSDCRTCVRQRLDWP